MSSEQKMEESIIESIRRPHYGGRIIGVGILVGSNESAERLKEFGPAILPVIERVLLCDMGDLRQASNKADNGLDDRLSVLCAYFAMADDFGYATAHEFLLKLSGASLDEAIFALEIEWGPNRREKRHEVRPPWLISALTILAEHRKNRSVGELLRRLLDD